MTCNKYQAFIEILKQCMSSLKMGQSATIVNLFGHLQISVDGLNFTLFNMLPSTLYEVAVASVGELGTSLPSPAVVFQTYWVPG